MNSFSDILTPNKFTLPLFSIENKDCVKKSDLIKRFMKVYSVSQAQAYRYYEEQCKDWETLREGRSVFVLVSNKWNNKNLYDWSKLNAEQLRCIIQAISSEFDITKYLRKAKYLYERKNLRKQIEVLKEEIKQIEEKLL